jgi:hypothetical protein
VFWTLVLKTAAVHTITYFVIGFVAYRLFKYRSTVMTDSTYNMRQETHPLVIGGVLFQPIRGFLFGIVFYLLKDSLFMQTNGWLVMWVMLVVVGIISTFAPAPSSIEGFIYTKTTFGRSWFGLLEILAQSLLFSFITFYWVNHPDYIWLNWLLYIVFIISIILPSLGLLANKIRTTG